MFVVGDRGGGGRCSHQLCECDREFVSCLSQYSCPHTKAMCKSPWRYFQNLFMGLGTGMVSIITKPNSLSHLAIFQPMADNHHHQNSIHGKPHKKKPAPPFKYPKPIFTDRFRLNMEFGNKV